MHLDITINDDDIPIIRRIKSSLLKQFRPQREGDIEKAIELANYMIARKKYTEAQKFLESFIYLDPNLNKLELWVVNGQGLVLLVYLTRITNQRELYTKYLSTLKEHDLWPADIGRIRWVRMHLADHRKNVENALSETHKYKCAVTGGIVNFSV